jgi:hypothetical protein
MFFCSSSIEVAFILLLWSEKDSENVYFRLFMLFFYGMAFFGLDLLLELIIRLK